MEHTFWVYDLILSYQRSLKRKYDLLKLHTIPLMYHLGNIGKVDGLIQWINNLGNQDNTTFNQQRNRVMSNLDIDGYLGLDREIGVNFEKRRQKFLDYLDTYQEEVNLLSLPSDTVTTLNPSQLRVLRI